MLSPVNQIGKTDIITRFYRLCNSCARKPCGNISKSKNGIRTRPPPPPPPPPSPPPLLLSSIHNFPETYFLPPVLQAYTVYTRVNIYA